MSIGPNRVPSDPRSAVEGALRLAQECFEREYGDGSVGLVLPLALAVDSQGGELRRIAVMPAQSGPRPPDRIQAQAVEEALEGQALPRAQAFATLRIDTRWPRILAWHRRAPVAVVSQPRFENNELIGWDGKWLDALPDQPAEASGVTSITAAGGSLGLLVKDLLRHQGERRLEPLREQAVQALDRQVSALTGAEPFSDFWMVQRQGATSREELPILPPITLNRVFAVCRRLLDWAEADGCCVVFGHPMPDGGEAIHLAAQDRASDAGTIGTIGLERARGEANLFSIDFESAPEQVGPAAGGSLWPQLDIDSFDVDAPGKRGDLNDPRFELLERRTRAVLDVAASRLTHPELDFPAFTICLDDNGDTFPCPGLLVRGKAASAVARRATQEARAMMVAIPGNEWRGDNQLVQLHYLDGDQAHMFATAFIERTPNRPGRVAGRTHFEPYPGSTG